MDMEEISNMSSNFTDEIYVYDSDLYERIFLELFTAVALLSMTANIFIIFVILRFKKLRQDITNIIIVHLNLVEAVYLLTTPLTLRVALLLKFVSDIHLTLLCVFYENEFILGIAVCFFLVLIIFDWYFKTYCEPSYVKFSNAYKFLIGTIYICSLFGCVVNAQFCFQGKLIFLTPLVMFVGYILLLVCLLVVNIVHLIRKKILRENKHNIGLFIGNSFFFLWCPAIIEMALINVRQPRGIPLDVILTFCLGFSSPVFNFAYLFYYVDSYNVFFKKVFKCQCNYYENEILEEQVVSYNDVEGVEFNK